MIVKSVLVLTSLMATCTGPTTSTEQRCPSVEVLLHLHNPGWDVDRMSRIAWRESRCTAAIRSTTADTGLLQINDVNHPYLEGALGEPVDSSTLMDPIQNVRAAAALFTYWERVNGNGYQPWKATDN